VSLSGYYAWKTRKDTWNLKEDREQQELKKIGALVQQGKRKWGYRTITMRLAQKSFLKDQEIQTTRVQDSGVQDSGVQDSGVHDSGVQESILMNHKKVLRLMRKYNLLAKIRRENPYKKIAKATQEHSVVPNILNRDFQCQIPKEWTWPIPIPYTKLWTDITYIRFNHRWVYLSLVKDMVTGETLSHVLSMTLELTIVQETYTKLKDIYQNNELQWAISHSDQWFHYTHPSFPNFLQQIWLIQSMSRRWNCIDNAPTESFFWHMKDELDYAHCTNFTELQEYFDEYMYYYNNDRPQWTRKKMTPVQYRNHLLEISKQKHIV
jgi:putative transposase